jgi:hypothetical protein
LKTSNQHEYILWILPAAFAAHVLEEYMLGFVQFAQYMAAPYGISLLLQDLFIVNIVVLIWGLCAAAIGWRLPVFSLTFPAMIFLNALLHLSSSIILGRLTPGVITGVLLYLPLSIWTYICARRDNVLKKYRIYWIFALTILFHIFGLALVLMRSRFGQ